MDLIDDVKYWIWDELLKRYVDVRYDGINYFFVIRDDNEVRDVLSKDEEWGLLLMKENLLWFRFDREIEIQKWQRIRLGQDYEVKVRWESFLVKDNISASLRYNIFSRWRDALERISGKKWLPLLQSWQYDVIKRMWKQTLFVASRRSGKSLLMTYLALASLFKPNPWRWSRPRSILFIWEK